MIIFWSMVFIFSDIFYQNKALFGKQSNLNRSVTTVCQLLNEPRINLHLVDFSIFPLLLEMQSVREVHRFFDFEDNTFLRHPDSVSSLNVVLKGIDRLFLYSFVTIYWNILNSISKSSKTTLLVIHSARMHYGGFEMCEQVWRRNGLSPTSRAHIFALWKHRTSAIGRKVYSYRREGRHVRQTVRWAARRRSRSLYRVDGMGFRAVPRAKLGKLRKKIISLWMVIIDFYDIWRYFWFPKLSSFSSLALP